MEEGWEVGRGSCSSFLEQGMAWPCTPGLPGAAPWQGDTLALLEGSHISHLRLWGWDFPALGAHILPVREGQPQVEMSLPGHF